MAKHLLMMSQDLKYYGGVTLEELSAATKLPITDVKEILSSFELNGWVMRKREYDTYLFFFFFYRKLLIDRKKLRFSRFVKRKGVKKKK